jgi:antitoxin component of RelBE/YafQ-DinJ toxin-antitoxin module
MRVTNRATGRTIFHENMVNLDARTVVTLMLSGTATNRSLPADVLVLSNDCEDSGDSNSSSQDDNNDANSSSQDDNNNDSDDNSGTDDDSE